MWIWSNAVVACVDRLFQVTHLCAVTVGWLEGQAELQHCRLACNTLLLKVPCGLDNAAIHTSIADAILGNSL
mgnify:CR=1 FL=1